MLRLYRYHSNWMVFLLFIIILIGISFVFCRSQKTTSPWNLVPQLVNAITIPTFPDRQYLVTDFGAKGDSLTDCFPAFRDAISLCTKEGGGRVVVPPGKYLIRGSIHLKSNVNLHLAEGARIEFSTDPSDYLPNVLYRWEGTELFNYSPFIYAYMATNIAITGNGEIDGNAKNSFATWKPKQKEDQLKLRQMGNDGVPIHDRVFGDGHWLRPGTILTYGCKNILIEGIRIYDAPFWVIHLTLSTNATVRNVVIDSWNPNNDGVDPDGAVNVLIEDCEFNCGDDAVAIKAGRDQDGWRVGQPTENVIIRNCAMNSKANGLCIGSEMSAGVRNIFMENCNVGEANSTIYFKANLDRGGIVENVYVRNITVKRANTAFIRFDSNYKGHRGNNYPPIFRNFYIENVTCQVADHFGIYAVAVQGTPITDVTLKDVTIRRAEIPTFTQYVKDFKLVNVMINGNLITEVPEFEKMPKSSKKITW